MKQTIIVRFSELTLKGKNKMQFVRKLAKNLRFQLFEKIKYNLIVTIDMFRISIDSKDIETIKTILNNTIGISGYVFVESFDTYEEFEKRLIVFSKTLKGTFKVFPKIREKGIVTSSDEFKRKVAGSILSNTELKVDIKNYDNKITVESYKSEIFLHTHTIKLPEGLPVGTNGKTLSLLSGGIDSPVATYMAMKRGMDVDYITFLTPPHTSEKSEIKIINIAKELNKFSGRIQKLYIVNYTEIQNELSHISDERYRIVLMRRSFLRIAGIIANDLEYDNLITGDSLGQVASQTINGLKVSSNATDALILRPLISISKNETIDIAKKINTFELSISEGEDTCSMFVPKSPTTKPRLGKALELEDELLILKDLELKVIEKNITVIKIGEK